MICSFNRKEARACVVTRNWDITLYLFTSPQINVIEVTKARVSLPEFSRLQSFSQSTAPVSPTPSPGPGTLQLCGHAHFPIESLQSCDLLTSTPHTAPPHQTDGFSLKSTHLTQPSMSESSTMPPNSTQYITVSPTSEFASIATELQSQLVNSAVQPAKSLTTWMSGSKVNKMHNIESFSTPSESDTSSQQRVQHVGTENIVDSTDSTASIATPSAHAHLEHSRLSFVELNSPQKLSTFFLKSISPQKPPIVENSPFEDNSANSINNTSFPQEQQSQSAQISQNHSEYLNQGLFSRTRRLGAWLLGGEKVHVSLNDLNAVVPNSF